MQALFITRAVKETNRHRVRLALVDLYRVGLETKDPIEAFLQSGSLNTRRDFAMPTFSIFAHIHPFDFISL